jgi:hypothetical protein
VPRLEFQLDAAGGEATPLRARVAVFTAARKRLEPKALKPVAGDPGKPFRRFALALSDLDAAAIDHLVVVVSNAGNRVALRSLRREDDDGLGYTVSICAP